MFGTNNRSRTNKMTQSADWNRLESWHVTRTAKVRRHVGVLLWVVMMACGYLSTPQPALGQVTTNRAGPGHVPSSLPRPTVSPYLQLGRNDNGALPSYQAFVQPQFDVLRQQQAQWSAIQRVEQVQRNMNAPYRATGRGARFMDTLHFYRTR